MRIGLVFNRRSGKGIDAPQIEEVLREFDRYNIDVVTSDESDIGDSLHHVISYHPDAIVAGGGDGTISSVAAKLTRTDISLGILPMGSSNHFAKDLGLPADIKECIGIIAAGYESPVDVAEVNGKIFINNSSIGVYPLAVVLRKEYQSRMGWSKRFAMLRAMLHIFHTFPTFTVRLDTDKGEYVRRTAFVFIGNNEYSSIKRDDLNEGKLSVYTAHMKGRWGIVAMGLLSMLGRLTEKYFDRHLVTEVDLETTKKKMIVSVDGEVIQMHPPLHYQIHPQALRVLLPQAESA